MVATSQVVSNFDAAWQAVSPAFEAALGKPYLYRRNGRYVPITAVLGRHEVEADKEQGVFSSWHGHAFELQAAQLALDGATFTPDNKQNDAVLERLADGTYALYEVVPPPKRRCYEPVDAEGFRIVVYTKIANASVSSL